MGWRECGGQNTGRGGGRGKGGAEQKDKEMFKETSDANFCF